MFAILSKFIVYAAYHLKASEAYQNTKRFFYDLLENPRSSRKTYFDGLMIE